MTTEEYPPGAGALSDSGTDTDGGDDYQLPNAADNIDLQGAGALIGADTVGTQADPVTALYANTVANIEMPAGGNVQSAIDSVASESNVGVGADAEKGLVKVKPGEVIDPGSTITVKPGVFLDASEALFAPSSDYDGFFVDNGARILGLYAYTDSTYTSRVAYLDTNESTNGKYAPGQEGGSVNGGATVRVTHRTYETAADTTSATAGGETVALVDSAAAGITNLPELYIDSAQAGSGLRLDVASGGYINTDIYARIGGCHHLIRHTGSDQARSNIRGTLQHSGATMYGIRNEAGSNQSIAFRGQFWDPANAGTSAIAGEKIQVVATNKANLRNWVGAGYTDGSFGQLVSNRTANRSQWYDGNSDNCHEIVYDNGRWEFYFNSNRLASFDERATGQGRWNFDDGSGGIARLWANNGELIGEDDAGTTTTLT